MAMIMVAGGLMPWKQQKKPENPPIPDRKELEEPLKPAPHGLRWHQLDDMGWELRAVQKASQANQDVEHEDDDTEEEEEEEEQREEEEGNAKDAAEGQGTQKHADVPERLENVVLPEDTPSGVFVRYKVKDRELRRLSSFMGSRLRLCDSPIVPSRVAAGKKPKQGAFDQKPQTEAELPKRKSLSSRLVASEPKHSLASKKWDLDKTPKERHVGRAWGSQRVVREAPSVSTPQPSRPSQPPPLPPTPLNWLRRRSLRLLGRYPPKAAPVGRLKTGPARKLHRSASHVGHVSSTTANIDW